MLRHLLVEDSNEVVTFITGPFLLDRIGKNDMSVINGLVASIAILIKAHCDKTGQDLDETAQLFHDSFDGALDIIANK
jgi:hypothetical protein